MLHRALTSLAAILVSGALSAGVCTSLGGCASSGGDGTGGGIHLPRPLLRASVAHLPVLSGPATTTDNATVEILAINPTDAPLWLRRLTITLARDEQRIAAGAWEGERQLDPGTSVLLDVSLPLVEGVTYKTLTADGRPSDTPDGLLTVETRYARSGLIGLIGGETYTYTLPVTLYPPKLAPFGPPDP